MATAAPIPTTAQRIGPQPGPQEAFLGTTADIAVYGGAAGGGKTYALLMEAARNVATRGYYGVIFRRTTTQIRNQGGLWDDSTNVYVGMGGVARESTLEWRFPSGAVVRFAHMEHEKNRFDWHGAQLTFIGFDELTQFTEKQFWYLLSRARSTCHVRPYVRCTCNPDPDSFVADLISWWIDEETGYPIPARSGVIRYFTRRGDTIEWGDSVEELRRRYPDIDPDQDVKSFTFIASSVYDNKVMLLSNPSYLSNLKALSRVDRERLLKGNWKIRPSAGMYHRREWYEVVDASPAGGVVVRYWDRAASEPSSEYPDPDWTVGTRMRRAPNGRYYIEDVTRFRCSPHGTREGIRNTASADGDGVKQLLERDPGQAGKVEVQDLVLYLAGFDVAAVPKTQSKETAAKPLSAQAEQGNVKVVRGKWNKGWFDVMENFPEGKHDDEVDSASGAFNWLSKGQEPRATWL